MIMAPSIAMETILLSLPKIMGMGPINTTPPVLTFVFSLPSVFPEDKKAEPMKIRSMPVITAAIPIKMMVSPLIMYFHFVLNCLNGNLDYHSKLYLLNHLLSHNFSQNTLL